MDVLADNPLVNAAAVPFLVGMVLGLLLKLPPLPCSRGGSEQPVVVATVTA
jgi:hypothetical protein